MEGSIITKELSKFENGSLWVILVVAFIGLLYGFYLMGKIMKEPEGNDKMKKVARAIQEGAAAYLNRQFKTIILLVVVIFGILFFAGGGFKIALGRSLAFLFGCIFSGLTGFVGMSLAVRGNVRVANAAQSSKKKALTLAFSTGAIAGMFTVGLGLLGATVIYMIFKNQAAEVLIGFGFGGSLLALFMRVGGGIFTKAADVGADLVGKVEKNIPEDDPRNAATIADNVGDNVGDCAGMAADIFESYEVTLVAAMILGAVSFGTVGVVFPLFVRAIGVITSIIGTYMVKAKSEKEHAMSPINRGFIWSALLSVIGFGIITYTYVIPYLVKNNVANASANGWKIFSATLAGIILAIIISKLTEYYTSTKNAPVKEVVDSTQTGPATTILSGISLGLESSVLAVIFICLAILSSIMIFHGAAATTILYGVSLTGMGMLTTTGVIVSMDTYGPISDNANGIAEMSGLPKQAREVLDELDAVGNSTKAITKGFAIGSAVIAAVALFGSYMESTGLKYIDVASPKVFIGLLIGGAIPFLFSSLTIQAVSRAAFMVVNEVRRQFREIKGIMEGKADPEYAKVVDICTKSALKELISPALLSILAPVIIGFALGVEALGGFLAGIILTGQLMAVFLSNSGGAWDNAKKSVEEGIHGGKGSEAHKAAVIGDTVGDPFKDTAGPALNPLIKVMNMVALLIAPLVVKMSGGGNILSIAVTVISLIIIIVSISISKRKIKK